MFKVHVGIDYSGAQVPDSRLPGLQVYRSVGGMPDRVCPPRAAAKGRSANWTRREIADWMVELARSGQSFIAGIDHGFSFPIDYFQRYGLNCWSDFLSDFVQYWPTDRLNTTVDSIRRQRSLLPDRSGGNTEFRLTEKWSSSAKSVFHFDVQGSVAKSTHAGLPWILRLKNEVGDRLHFWPFEGWQIPAGKSVVAEVFPSIFRNRYLREGRKPDQQDAYAIARWLYESDQHGFLESFFAPRLTDDQLRQARLEGWILGLM